MLEKLYELMTPWLISGGILAAVVFGVLVGHRLVYRLLEGLAARTPGSLDNSFVRCGRKPVKMILPLLAVVVILPTLPLTGAVLGPLRHIVGLGLIAATAWLCVSLLSVLDDAVARKFRIDIRDKLSARRVQT